MSHSIQGSFREASLIPSSSSQLPLLEKVEDWSTFRGKDYLPLGSVLKVSLDGAFGETFLEDQLQAKLNDRLAFLKFKLGLRKEDCVTYMTSGHFLLVKSQGGAVERRYDLWMDGLEKDCGSLVCIGGGVKQIFSDRGLFCSDEKVKALTKHVLPQIGREIREIVNIKEERYWWDWRKGVVDFSFRVGCPEVKRVLESKERSFFLEALYHWGLVNWNDQKFISWNSWMFKDPALNERGVEAFLDIHKALLLQEIVLDCLSLREDRVREGLDRLGGMEGMRRKVRLRRKRALEREIEEMGAIKREMREGVNYGVLHFILMELNRHMDGSLFVEGLGHIGKAEGVFKKWLFPMFSKEGVGFKEESIEGIDLDGFLKRGLTHFTSSKEKWAWADYLRRDVLDQIAIRVVSDFEWAALARRGFREKVFSWRSRGRGQQDWPLEETQQVATDLGALIYDVAMARFQKVEFLQNRDWGVQRRSRAIEFLIQGAIFSGEANLQGFYRERESIQEVLLESLRRFKERVLAFKEKRREPPRKIFLYPAIEGILKRERKIAGSNRKSPWGKFFMHLFRRMRVRPV